MTETVCGLPHAHASAYTHEKVFAWLAQEPRGKLLDAPAGEGPASRRFQAAGFEVYAADLDADDFKLTDVHFDVVDLNARLPYPEGFFDYAICVEGIEHIENPHHLIREFRRVLKAGGKLIITTPNVLCVYSRLRFLLSGYADWIHSRINRPVAKRASDLLERHINMLGYPELHFILRENGFAVEVVSSNQSCLSYPWGPWWGRPFAAAVFFLTAVVIQLYNRLIKKDTVLSELLLTDDLLFGELIMVKARKQAA